MNPPDLRASDIMTSPVISVAPTTTVLQVAALLRENRIGGVPVLAGGELAGIVTERDLLHRQEIGTGQHQPRPAWWRRVLAPAREPERYVKSHGRSAGHVMTREVVVVHPATTLQEITALFDRHGIGRVPVMAAGGLVGIVASADLVKALARGQWVGFAQGAAPDDAAMRELLLRELAGQDWWTGDGCSVEVRQGVVRFTGFAENDAQREASCVAAENIPGVREVRDERALLAELPVLF